MRPKKVILCVNGDEQELSLLKFMLATHSYRVLQAVDADQAINVLRENPVDLVLVEFNLPKINGIEAIHQLKTIAEHTPMILFADPAKLGTLLHQADGVFSRENLPTVELLGRIKVISARKRGPRKGCVSPFKGVHRAAPAMLAIGKAV
jgi:DNA-binding response OmpR family regulator